MSDSFDTQDSYLNEYKMLHDSLFKIWQMYISWFTWYFGMNFFGFAWILSAEKLQPNLIAPVGFVMTLENLIALVPTWTMRSYTRSIRERASDIAAASPETPTVEPTRSIFGNQIMDRTVVAILAGLGLLSICWIYVIILGWAPFRAKWFGGHPFETGIEC